MRKNVNVMHKFPSLKSDILCAMMPVKRSLNQQRSGTTAHYKPRSCFGGTVPFFLNLRIRVEAGGQSQSSTILHLESLNTIFTG